MHRPFTPHELEHVISTPRFSTYLDACAQNPEHALALYRWNLEISAGFMGPLHLCEIAVRNSVSQSIEAIHGQTWPWIEGFVKSVPKSTRNHLQQATKIHITTDKVVSEIKFFFWEQMLTQRFDKVLWKRQFFNSFPGAPRQDGPIAARKVYYDNVHESRILRNRIAHHEPIFTRNLQNDLNRVLQIIAWRNPVAARWLSEFEPVSKFLQIQNLGRQMK